MNEFYDNKKEIDQERILYRHYLQTQGLTDQDRLVIQSFSDPDIEITPSWQAYIEEALKLGLL